MKSSTTPSFWRAYRTLNPDIQVEARKAYQLWKANPRHPSLRFARKGDFWSARITRDCRALARLHEGTFYWIWIGSHEEYQRLIK
jgi:hypothetical protein